MIDFFGTLKMSPDVDWWKPLVGSPLPRARPYHLNFFLCEFEQDCKAWEYSGYVVMC